LFPACFTARFILSLLFPCLLLPFTACVAGLSPPPLPPGLLLRTAGPVDRGGIVVWAPDGERIALAYKGTRIRNLATGAEEVLDSALPVALCWSADGEKLVAAYAVPAGLRLRLFALGSVGPVGETTVPGRVAGLFCPDDGSVVVIASVLRTFSFGGNFATSLYRWDGANEPTAIIVNDVSVKPLTLKKLGASIFDLVQPQLAPMQDELLFTRLHDPPALAPYFQLVQVHLLSGSSRVVADLPLTSSGGRYLAQGERVLVADGQGSTLLIDPWTQEVAAVLSLPGHVLATSPVGSRQLVDGHLFVDDKEIAVLPDVDAAGFAPRGDRLLIRRDGDLFLLEYLPAEPRPSWFVDPLRQRLLKLRQWRSSGLINHTDYLNKRGEMLP